MQMKIVLLAPWLMLLTIGVSAQTVTGSGISGTIPVFTGSSTVGNSVITQSSGNVLNVAGSIVRSGFLSTRAHTAKLAIVHLSAPAPYLAGSVW
ncbi:hypothetical protein HDF15_001371 [Granulicella mallensis]|uniref:Uncharacterized protein n=1 Tax=Granulicella mallensis TaxID=940614 RepID=A0A7W8E8W6_9BACT|nr:hypothetical protein [Granulicella mallensis]